MLARALAAAVLVVLVMAGLALIPAQHNTGPEPDGAIRIIPVLEVYKNGVKVYEKTGDPPTHNLAMLFFLVVAPRDSVDGTDFQFTVTMMDGTGKTVGADHGLNGVNYDTVDDHTLWVLAGSGTGTPSYNDYTMNILGYGEAKAVSFSYNDTSKAWTLEIAGTVQFSSATNITDVGLAVDVAGSNQYYNVDNPADYPDRNVLIFHDKLPSPISVNNGDSITIKYTIMFVFP